MSPSPEQQLILEATEAARKQYPDASELAIASQAVLELARRSDEFEHGDRGVARDPEKAALYYRAAVQAHHRVEHLKREAEAAPA